MRIGCFRLVHLEKPVLMTDLSCKCFCRPGSCFSRSSHCIHPPPLSGILADGHPGHPPGPSPVPDAAESPQAAGDGVTVPVEDKRGAPTETGETRDGEQLADCENGEKRSMDDGTDGNGDELQIHMPLKSSLKRPCDTRDSRKGRVKWMDILGKDLVQVQEFECSDSEDHNGEHSLIHSCGCVIQ